MEGTDSKSRSSNTLHILCSIINAILLVVAIGFSVAILVFTLNTSVHIPPFHSHKLPVKYAPRFDQPHTTQGNRGTCWEHGTIAGLSHSYRRNGLLNHYLNSTEYVPFSIQSFAISTIKLCQNNKYNESICRELQAGPELNTTSGGEVAWLYYMPELYDKLYPLSLCPYLDEDKDEWKCDNLEGALKNNSNPIRFNIKNMTTTYTIEETKKELYRSQLIAPLSVAVWVNLYYIPCPSIVPTSNESEFSYLCSTVKDSSSLVTCPKDIYIPTTTNNNNNNSPSSSSSSSLPTDYKCLLIRQPGYNLDGEWYMKDSYEIEGGHCMVIQGWNDEYVSKNGDKGGFPIKNSWYDRAYKFELPHYSRGGRASHSLQYLMNEISLQEERMICPNAHNPDNWLSCTSLTPQSSTLPSESDPLSFSSSFLSSSSNEVPRIDACLNDSFVEEKVKWERRPMEFCLRQEAIQGNEGCVEDGFRYFLDYITHLPDGLVTVSFVKVKKQDTTQTENIILKQVPIGYVAEKYAPIDNQMKELENDADNCGLYWMPYAASQNTVRDRESWSAAFFDIEWEDSSYLINANKYPQYDYQYLKKSQTTRKTWSWDGPIAHARPGKENPKEEI